MPARVMERTPCLSSRTLCRKNYQTPFEHIVLLRTRKAYDAPLDGGFTYIHTYKNLASPAIIIFHQQTTEVNKKEHKVSGVWIFSEHQNGFRWRLESAAGGPATVGGEKCNH